MDYSHLYGEGKGQAKVWGRNVGLDMLAQAYEQDRKRREKEDADIQAEVAKINYDGVRQADIPYFTKRYNDVKTLHRQLAATTNSTERAQLRANLEVEKQKFFAETAQSKQEGQTWGELGKLKFTKPDDLSDTFTQDYVVGNNLSTFDPNYKPHVEKLTSTMFAPNFDVNKETKGILEQSVVPIKDQIKQGRVGSLSYVEKVTGTELDPKIVKAKVHAKATGSNVFRRQLKQMFPTLNEGEREDAFAEQIYKENEKAYRITKSANIGSQYDIRPSWSDLHPKTDKTDSEKDANYRYNWAKDMIQGVPGSGEQLKGILAGAGGYKDPLIIKTPDTKTLVFHVPERSVTKTDQYGLPSTVTYPKRVITIDKTDPNAIVTMNRMISDITGENVPVSKLLTEGARGKGKVLNKPTGGKTNNNTNNSGSTTKTVSYVVDGVTYNIPSDKVSAFLKAKPKAKKL